MTYRIHQKQQRHYFGKALFLLLGLLLASLLFVHFVADFIELSVNAEPYSSYTAELIRESNPLLLHPSDTITEDYDIQPAGGEWLLSKTFNPQHN